MFNSEDMNNALDALSERQVRGLVLAFEGIDVTLSNMLRTEDDERSIYRLQGSSRLVQDYITNMKHRLEGK